ncbi:MAG TPA: TIGR03086 family metal-binding protein [Acidimicrobiales bacterium]|nr:TIGR03086 family metal-binding protein [Acidimicrobiales bacterium]
MTIEKSVLVPRDADQTFALLTEPERLRRWQGISARVDLRAGGEYRWTVVPGVNAGGTFVEIEPGRRLVFTWGWEGNDALPPGASTVTITMEPAEGGTMVRLVHEGLTGDQESGHLKGWSHYAERLAAAARDGDAGMDQWMQRSAEELDQLSAAEASLALCQHVLRHMDPAAGSAQTPCAKFDVDQLVEHLTGSIVTLGAAVGVTVMPASGSSREARLADTAQPVLEGWHRRGLDGTVKLVGGELPAEIGSRILSMEFLVHAWDFAQATGQDLPANEALSGYVLGLAHGLIASQMRDGDLFADEVVPGPQADAITRLAAFTGRSV